LSNRGRQRPTIWALPSDTDWPQNDTTKVYTIVLFNDAGKTRKRDITGKTIFIVISRDFPYREDYTVNVSARITDPVNGEIKLTFPIAAVGRVGEFKMEVYESGTERNYSHHEDFNVV